MVSPHVSRHFGACRVGAATSDAHYEDLHIAWEDHIGPHATIAVSAHGTGQNETPAQIAVKNKRTV